MQLPRFLSTPLFWRSLVLIWAGTLWWLSSQSQLPSPAEFEGVDKFEHTTYFTLGGMCFLLSLRLAGAARRPASAFLFSILFCAIIGLVDEIHQMYTPGRSGGDVWDWSADTLGGFFGAALALLAERWLLTSAETTTSAAQ